MASSGRYWCFRASLDRLQSNALGRRRPRDREEMVADTRSYLRSTQRRPDIVVDYFEGERQLRKGRVTVTATAV